MRKAVLWVVAVGLFSVLSVVGCKKSEEKKAAPGAQGLPGQSDAELGETIATVDGVNITVGDVQDRINKQSPYIRARYTSVERKKEFLDNLIRFEVLAKEAQKRGLDKDPEVVRTMKQVMIQKLMKDEFETRVKPEDITDAEMQKYYEEHKAEYNKPEEVRASAIIVKDKKTADKVAAEAKAATGQDSKGFRDLVAKYSQDEASKQRFGDLQYFAQDSAAVPPEVVKAAFATEKTGDVVGPIATKANGFYIIKQTGRRKALAKSFDEVKRQIQNRLYRERRTKAMEDFVSNLKNSSKIEIHEDKLAKVRIDTSQPAAPTGEPHGDGDDMHEMPHPGAPGAQAPGNP